MIAGMLGALIYGKAEQAPDISAILSDESLSSVLAIVAQILALSIGTRLIRKLETRGQRRRRLFRPSRIAARHRLYLARRGRLSVRSAA